MNLTIIWDEILNWLSRTFQSVPSGSSSGEVQAYYNDLYTYRFEHMPQNRATDLAWTNQAAIFSWAIVIILTFFLYTYFFNRAHRKHGELYGATNFAGALQERNGTVSIFTWFGIAALFIWCVYYGIRSILIGYIY